MVRPIRSFCTGGMIEVMNYIMPERLNELESFAKEIKMSGIDEL
ncbi:nickel-dependent hydrogenase large subunit [Bacillus pseudomycoides]|nr:nickel-dependent hydrogenase large subunit [Bacillus pseudomycoides]